MLSTQGGASLGDEEASVAQRVKNLPAVQETWVQSLGQEDPLEKGMGTHSGTLAWKILWPGKPNLTLLNLERVVGHFKVIFNLKLKSKYYVTA